MYAPTISFVAVSVGRIVNLPRLDVGVAKPLTYIAPNHGVHGEGVRSQRKAAHEKPGTQEDRAGVHAIDLPWNADKRKDASEKSGGGKESEFGRGRHEGYRGYYSNKCPRHIIYTKRPSLLFDDASGGQLEGSMIVCSCLSAKCTDGRLKDTCFLCNLSSGGLLDVNERVQLFQ